MTVITSTTSHADAAPIPLACTPGAIAAAERASHGALLARLFATAGAERRAVAGGYEYRFDAAAFDDLARWIANERRCCPFLSFALELAPDSGPIRLRLTGPEGTRRLLDAALHAARRDPGVDARGEA